VAEVIVLKGNKFQQAFQVKGTSSETVYAPFDSWTIALQLCCSKCSHNNTS